MPLDLPDASRALKIQLGIQAWRVCIRGYAEQSVSCKSIMSAWDEVSSLLRASFFGLTRKPSVVEGDNLHEGCNCGPFLALRALRIVFCHPRVTSSLAACLALVSREGRTLDVLWETGVALGSSMIASSLLSLDLDRRVYRGEAGRVRFQVRGRRMGGMDYRGRKWERGVEGSIIGMGMRHDPGNDILPQRSRAMKEWEMSRCRNAM